MYIKNILFFILFSRCLNLKIELKKKFLILNTIFSWNDSKIWNDKNDRKSNLKKNKSKISNFSSKTSLKNFQIKTKLANLSIRCEWIINWKQFYIWK